MNASMKAEPAVQAERRSKEAGPGRLGNKFASGPLLTDLSHQPTRPNPKADPGSDF